MSQPELAQPLMYFATQSLSRYGLLGAMGDQVATALDASGVLVNPAFPPPPVSAAHPRVAFAWFNHPASMQSLRDWIDAAPRGGKQRACLQWCVDHPLTIPAAFLDQMSQDPDFRLLTVTCDDLHVLALRFPKLRCATLWHGVDTGALCEAEPAALAASHAGRDIDVLLSGSIPSSAELDRLRSVVPTTLHGMCDDLIAVRCERPEMPFGQVLDIVAPSGMFTNDHWQLMQAVFAYTTAAVGRARRVGVLKSLRGLNVTVLGSDAWNEVLPNVPHATFAGLAEYGHLPSWFKRAKVSVAVNPPQFASGFSERVLLSLAAGCGTVAEDRFWTKQEFSECCLMFDGSDMNMVRDRVETLLRDEPTRLNLAHTGRNTVEQRHLWLHRIRGLLLAAGFDNLDAQSDLHQGSSAGARSS